MKAVVTEVRGKRAVVLAGDGLFRNIKNNGYSVGQRIELKWWDWKLSWVKVRAAHLAAALLVMLSISAGGTAYAFYTPASYVSLDINPSLLLDINYFGRVINVHPVNKEAEELVQGLDVKYLEVDEAVVNIVKKASSAGYLDNPDTNAVLITASVKHPEKFNRTAQNILKETEEITGSRGATVTIEVDNFSQAQLQKAREYNTTPGKIRMIEKYIDSLPPETACQVSVSELVKKPVKEVMSEIKQNRKQLNHGNVVQIEQVEVKKENKKESQKVKQKENKNKLEPVVKIDSSKREIQEYKEKDSNSRKKDNKKNESFIKKKN